jgi:hypothetical protein
MDGTSPQNLPHKGVKMNAIEISRHLTTLAQKQLGTEFSVFPKGDEFDLIKTYGDGRRGCFGTSNKTDITQLINNLANKTNNPS